MKIAVLPDEFLKPYHNDNNIIYKHGFEYFTEHNGLLDQWNFDRIIVDIVSWLAINIGEPDDTRWNVEIRLKYSMNPITSRYDRILIFFVRDEDAMAFKLRWL